MSAREKDPTISTDTEKSAFIDEQLLKYGISDIGRERTGIPDAALTWHRNIYATIDRNSSGFQDWYHHLILYTSNNHMKVFERWTYEDAMVDQSPWYDGELLFENWKTRDALCQESVDAAAFLAHASAVPGYESISSSFDVTDGALSKDEFVASVDAFLKTAKGSDDLTFKDDLRHYDLRQSYAEKGAAYPHGTDECEHVMNLRDLLYAFSDHLNEGPYLTENAKESLWELIDKRLGLFGQYGAVTPAEIVELGAQWDDDTRLTPKTRIS